MKKKKNIFSVNSTLWRNYYIYKLRNPNFSLFPIFKVVKRTTNFFDNTKEPINIKFRTQQCKIV